MLLRTTLSLPSAARPPLPQIPSLLRPLRPTPRCPWRPGRHMCLVPLILPSSVPRLRGCTSWASWRRRETHASVGGEWKDGNKGVLWSCEEIIQATGGTLLSPGPPGCVCTDTRQLTEGDWFLALRGERFDGKAFLAQAREAGCTGAISEGPMPEGWDRGYVAVADGLQALQALGRGVRIRFHGPVVGVTGSMGKSSATTLAQLALSPLGPVHKTAGNFNNHVGLPLSLLAMRSDSRACVLELGMSSLGEIAALTRICTPNIRVVLNVGPAHLESLGSLEAVACAKQEILDTSPRPGDVCVFNADDPFVASMPVPDGCTKVTFGYSETADIQVMGAQPTSTGDSILVHLRHNKEDTATALPGAASDSHISEDLQGPGTSSGGTTAQVVVPSPMTQMAYNVAAAAAVAVSAGVPFCEAVGAMSRFQPAKQRMQVVRLRPASHVQVGAAKSSDSEGDDCLQERVLGAKLIDDCYNANPESMKAALEVLRRFPGGGRRIAALGDMLELGPFSSVEHRKVLSLCGRKTGDASPLWLHQLLLVGPHFQEAAQGMVSSGWEFPSLSTHADVHSLVMWMEQGMCGKLDHADVILVKGSRGMRMDLAVECMKAT